MNPVFHHPDQPEMQAQVILSSQTDHKEHPNISTIRLRYPRFIHSELMTHRVFSRNARSSRAVPVQKMIKEIYDTPVIPWHWGKNQKGMQASEECNEFIPIKGLDELTREEAWKCMAEYSADTAKAFSEAGYHKQVVNRLLEPFMWIDTLVSSTHWANFLWLRDHEAAEPHIRDLARLIHQAIKSSSPYMIDYGDWHLPYITDEEKQDYDASMLIKASAARCARISYTPFDSDTADISRDLDLFQKLIKDDRIHASPMEHQATPDSLENKYLCGVAADGSISRGDHELIQRWGNENLHGNLTGWIQFRKMIPFENYTLE